MKGLIIVLVVIGIVILSLGLGYLFVGNYFYDIAINPNSDKSALGIGVRTEEETIRRKEWLKNNSKDTYITSTNNGNLKLHAYEIETSEKSNIWTIVVHGYTKDGIEMEKYAERYKEKGYNVLLVDLRGAGMSEGDYVGFGWHDRLDIIDWINYLVKRDSNCEIILFGVSMGAATVMMSTGESLPSNVRLAIEDCGYTSVYDIFANKIENVFHLPSKPVLSAANFVTKIKAGYTLYEASSLEQIKKSQTPTLFIHGSADTFVPYNMLDILYNTAKCEKEKLVIEGAEHAVSVDVNPELYWKTIDDFIGKHI